MAEIRPGNDVWGRIGQNFGSGVGEGITKENDRSRLASGLSKFEKESEGLTPLQQFTRLAAIPGITPQMIQTVPEILKQQGRRSAYTGQNGQKGQFNEEGNPQQEPEKFKSNLPVQFGSNRQRPQTPKIEAEIKIPDNLTTNPSERRGVNESNPLPGAPRRPWSNERYMGEVGNFLRENPQATIEDAEKIIREKEARELAQPMAEQDIQNYYEAQQGKLDQGYETLLVRKGVKPGDIDGETDQRIRNAMYDYIKEHPEVSIHKAAETWSDRTLDLAKAQTQFDKLASKGLLEEPAEKKLEKLKSLQKIYDRVGNNEGFYNRLISDFSLTPQYAALIAYPRSNSVKEYISSVPRAESAKDSVSIAANIKDKIGDNDSLLAIAKELKGKVRNFDEGAFFNEIRNNQDKYRLNERQRRELSEAEASIFPSWGDLWLFPIFGSSKAHD